MVFMSICMSGCKTGYVPIESVRTEYKDRLLRDSIHIVDSVIIREKSGTRIDTIEITRWRTEYRDRLKVDSIFICDSIQIPYPVERSLSKWQKIKMDMGGIAIGGIIAIIIGLIIHYLIKIRKR